MIKPAPEPEPVHVSSARLSADEALGLPEGLPPDWTLDRDLPCPQCSYNLRGRRAPRCAECGERFSWQALLGVSCPRCGVELSGSRGHACPGCQLELNWAALLSTSTGAPPLLEYSPRPWRARADAMWRLLRPRRFWSGVPLECAPRVEPLRRFERFALLLLLSGIAALVLVERLGRVFPAPGVAQFWNKLWAGLQHYARSDAVQAVIFLAAISAGLIWLTSRLVPLFTPTLTRFRIRTEQLRRLRAYCWVPALWLATIYWTCALFCIWRLLAGEYVGFSVRVWLFDIQTYGRGAGSALWLWFGGDASRLPNLLRIDINALLLTIIMAGHIALALALGRILITGLRYYLRLDRLSAEAIAVSSITIAALAVALALTASTLLIHIHYA